MLNQIIKKISNIFFEEALASPNLLSDMAAMEKYMAESYNGRIFLQNRYNVTEYVTFSLSDTSDDEASMLYDKGIDEWGNIQVSYGTSVIDINKGENYFYFASKNTWKKKEQETILVKNIKSVIEKQKALIK